MKHPTRIVLVIIAFWLTAQFIGLVIVEHYANAPLPSNIERPDLAPSIVPLYILGGVLIGTGLVLLLAKFGQKSLWTLWFSLAILTLAYVALAAFVPDIVAFLAAGVFVWFKLDTRLHWIIRNIPELFIYAGMGAIFVPMLTVPIALGILIAISLYDAYAVWRSKHMVSLATFQIESGRFAGFSIPKGSKPKRTRTKPRNAPKNRASNGGTAILGGGDFAFPLLYTGTILLFSGWTSAVLSTIGGYLGLLTLFIISKEGRFYPAMPFLAAGLIIGSLI